MFPKMISKRRVRALAPRFWLFTLILVSGVFSAKARAENKYWQPNKGMDCSNPAAPSAFSVQGVHIRLQASGYGASVTFNDKNAHPVLLKASVRFFQQVSENKFEVKMSGPSFQLHLTVETDKGHTENYDMLFSSRLLGQVKTAQGKMKNVQEFWYCKT